MCLSTVYMNSGNEEKEIMKDVARIEAEGKGAKLFCKHSQVAFMPYGVDLKDERRTSNIELKTNIQYRTFNHAKAWFLFSRFDTRNENLN
jgi:hypothetical protein